MADTYIKLPIESDLPQKIPKTAIIESFIFFLAGLSYHPIYLFSALPALVYSLKTKEHIKQKKWIKAKSNANIAEFFNIISCCLTLMYFSTFIISFVYHYKRMEYIGPSQAPHNSILLSFIFKCFRGSNRFLNS